MLPLGFGSKGDFSAADYSRKDAVLTISETLV
jgi:hypothetical protein